jgi:hypothetical protein
MWATSVNFQKLPKENNRPLGELSPNLVTLIIDFLVVLHSFTLFKIKLS